MVETTAIFGNNQAAISTLTPKVFQPRTRHFNIRLQHFRDLVKQGIVDLTYIKSEDNVAQTPTKGLKGMGLR